MARGTPHRLLVLALAVPAATLLAACGGGTEGSTPPTVADPGTVSTTAPTADCSAAALELDLPEQPEVPPAVARKRSAIAEAAFACDYERLAALASPEGFTFSYGASGDAAAYWRRLEETEGDAPTAALVRILALPHATNEIGWHTWPSAHRPQPVPADWTALVESGVYSADEVEQMRAAGSYYGWRVGIRPDGEWMFFVAGD